jgi:hypothetical protein
LVLLTQIGARLDEAFKKSVVWFAGSDSMMLHKNETVGFLSDKEGRVAMVTKKEKAQATDRSGSGARGKTHKGGGSDQQGGGKKASSGGASRGGGQPGGGQSGGQGN